MIVALNGHRETRTGHVTPASSVDSMNPTNTFSWCQKPTVRIIDSEDDFSWNTKPSLGAIEGFSVKFVLNCITKIMQVMQNNICTYIYIYIYIYIYNIIIIILSMIHIMIHT